MQEDDGGEEVMPRRRRQPSPVELALDLAAPVIGLFCVIAVMMTFFAPNLLKIIIGLIQLMLVVLVCGGVAFAGFLVIRAVVGGTHKPSVSNPTTMIPRSTPAAPSMHLNPFETISRSEWDLDRSGPQKPQPTQAQSLQQRLRAIDWFQFEKVVSAIYEVRGCTVRRLGGAKPDGGIDLIVENGDERLVVQCKHWRKWSVGVRHVRELLGTLTDAKIETGVLVTLRGCTCEAKELADKHKIVIVEEAELVELMRNMDGSTNRRIGEILNDTRKLCPRCERPLVMRTAKKGHNLGQQFWGCSNYPRCRYILRNA